MELTTKVRQCQRCPLHRSSHCRVAGVGMGNARIMVVGQAPGWEEDREGEPFIGQAGQFLQTCLEKVGVSINDVWWTNLVKCYPGKKPGGDAEPPAYAVEACRTWLAEEYALIQPALIVAVGAISMHFFGVKGGININAGQVFDTDWGPVLPILHPAGLMRTPVNVPQFKTQLNRINTFLRGADTPPSYSLELA